MRKLFTLLCAFCCTLAISAYGFSVDGIYYNIISSKPYEVEVTSSSNKYTGTVSIPSSVSHKGTTYAVTRIGDYAFEECANLTSITLPESVTSIGYRAFSGTPWYNNLPDGVVYIGKVLYRWKGEMPVNTTIVVPNGIASISDYAFEECANLTSITLPESVMRIGHGVFEGCTGLTSITIPESVTSIGTNAFLETPWYNNLPDGVIYIGNVLYKWKGEMPENTKVVVREGTTNINDEAFSGCTGLTNITLPESVTEIGYNAFSGCIGLTSISIPESVTSIGALAFSGCTGLTNISIPESVTSIGAFAFYYCTNLRSITLPESITSVGTNAFLETPWYNDLPNGVVYIGRILYKWKGEMPENTKVVVREGTTSINENAFYGCENLTSITLPKSITEIGWYAFHDCKGLTSISLPKSVTSIGGEAFFSCTSLAIITCLAIEVPITEGGAFENYNATLYVPCESVEAYQQDAVFGQFTHIEGINCEATNIEKTTVEGLQVIDSKVICYEPFRIYTLAGIELTAQNGALPAGVYIVRTATATQKILLP